MRTYTADGLTLRWTEDIAASPASAPRRARAEVWPVSPGNAVTMLYSIDGGPERAARAWPEPGRPGADHQRFVADLPATRPDEQITWRPVVTNGAHRADPGPGPAAIRPAPTTGMDETGAARFDYDLRFLARVTAPLDHAPYAVGKTPDGLRIVFPLGKGGTVRGPVFNGTIDHVGGDWMRIRDDGIGVTDIHALIQTEDGATILTEYSGFADFGPDGQSRLNGGTPPAQANLNLTPRYQTSSPRWSWLNRLQCVGFGRVTMATLLVEYDLYAMQSRAAPAPERSVPHV